MARETVDPVEKQLDGVLGGTEFSHPAFGQIEVNNISGQTNLYGSDFRHHDFVRITIYESKLRRDLSHDSYFKGKRLAQVDLSHDQWSTFVSSFGQAGTPCTITWMDGGPKPAIPYRDEGQEFKIEANAALEKSVASPQAARKKVAEGLQGLSKARQAEVLKEIDNSIAALRSSLPFIADSFAEHVEKRTEKAKTEIAAFTTQTLQRAGLEALVKNGQMPLTLEDQSGE